MMLLDPKNNQDTKMFYWCLSAIKQKSNKLFYLYEKDTLWDVTG